MKTFYECLPCFVNQALSSLTRTGATVDQIEKTMRKVFCELAVIDFNASPPFTASKIYREVSKETNVVDPYIDTKRRSNQYAMRILSEMQDQIGAGSNVFLLKVKLAIAANIIDFGKHANLTECEVLACFNTALEKSIDEEAVISLSEVVQSADSVLFLCDNAGEIVFDRYLIQELPRQKITCAVRGAPAINDALLEDASFVGLSDTVKVISNGSDIPGTVLETCSDEFKKAFYDADVVIAKGQGNFETLSEIKNKRIFFLLQVKCPVIARDIGFPIGTFVIKDNCSGRTIELNDQMLVK